MTKQSLLKSLNGRIDQLKQQIKNATNPHYIEEYNNRINWIKMSVKRVEASFDKMSEGYKYEINADAMDIQIMGRTFR